MSLCVEWDIRAFVAAQREKDKQVWISFCIKLYQIGKSFIIAVVFYEIVIILLL